MGGPATAFGLGPSPIPVLRPQKPLHMPGGDGHRGKSLKLLEKIPPGNLDSSLCFFQSSVSHDVLCIEVK